MNHTLRFGTTLLAVLLGTALAQGALEAHPMSIEALRQGSYPGSAITLEQTLAPGANYRRYIASYRSEGLKIYGLLTVPNGTRPRAGWPAIVFVHGYIPPAQYRTTERYKSEGVWGSYKTHPFQGWDTWTPPRPPLADIRLLSQPSN